MKFAFKILLGIVFNFCLLNLHAQSEQDQRLALNYYNQGEFDKAITYYERIYNAKLNTQSILKNYIIAGSNDLSKYIVDLIFL